MSFHICCVPGCIARSVDGVTLHLFPDPKKDLNRFQSWVHNVGGELGQLDDMFIYRNRKVCHRHFEDKYRCAKNRLSKIAIPALHLPGAMEVEVSVTRKTDIMHNDAPKVNQTFHADVPTPSTRGKPVAIEVEVSSARTTDTIPTDVTNTTDTFHTGVPKTSARIKPGSIENIVPKIASLNKTADYNPVHIPKPTTSGIRTNKKWISEAKSMKKQLAKLQAKVNKILRVKNSFKRRLALAERSRKTAIFEMLNQNSKLEVETRNFINMQLRLAGKKNKGRRFTLQEKILALSLYKPSPRAYRVLSELCILPKRKTLQKILRQVELLPGINKKMFANLKNKVSKMPKHHRYCSLLFDEMAIAPNLTYDRKKDEIIGFQDTGTKKTESFADHVLVFMVRGIVKKYKQPVAYTFCSSTTSTVNLKHQISSIIQELQSCGLKVVATVCDQGVTNIAAVNALINDTKAKYLRENKKWTGGFFEVGSKKVIPIYDPPHLIKGIRNNMLNKKLTYKSEDGKSCTAKWEHIMQLYKRSPGYRGVRLASKLTAHHVIPNLIPKMKVKHATQVFSSTVAVTLGYMADSGILPEECKDTADILLFFDHLFDSVNGSFSQVKNGKNYRAAVTPRSPHHKLWSQSLRKLKDMKFCDMNGKNANVPTLSSWIKTIEGFDSLTKMLHKIGINSILLRNINQDALENFFGAIRAHGQSNIMPNATAFIAAYKTLLINNITSSHSVGANCEKDESRSLQNLTYFFENATNVAENSSVSIDEHSLNENHLNISLIDTDKLMTSNKRSDIEKCAAIGYCSGWLIKLAKTWVFKGCTTCKSDLQSVTICDFHNYIKISEYSDKGWLIYPTRKIFDLFAQIENIVYEILRTDCVRNNIADYMKLIVTLHLDFNFITCDTHREKLVNYLISKNILFCLNNWCKEINQTLTGKSNVQDDADAIKTLAFKHFMKNKTRKRTRQTGVVLGM